MLLLEMAQTVHHTCIACDTCAMLIGFWCAASIHEAALEVIGVVDSDMAMGVAHTKNGQHTQQTHRCTRVMHDWQLTAPV